MVPILTRFNLVNVQIQQHDATHDPELLAYHAAHDRAQVRMTKSGQCLLLRMPQLHALWTAFSIIVAARFENSPLDTCRSGASPSRPRLRWQMLCRLRWPRLLMPQARRWDCPATLAANSHSPTFISCCWSCLVALRVPAGCPACSCNSLAAKCRRSARRTRAPSPSRRSTTPRWRCRPQPPRPGEVRVCCGAERCLHAELTSCRSVGEWDCTRWCCAATAGHALLCRCAELRSWMSRIYW